MHVVTVLLVVGYVPMQHCAVPITDIAVLPKNIVSKVPVATVRLEMGIVPIQICVVRPVDIVDQRPNTVAKYGIHWIYDEIIFSSLSR
jgi:hypothetical protein